MKIKMKIQIVLLFSIFAFVSCEKNVIGDFGEPDFVDETEDAVNKKGAAFSNRTEDWSFKTSDLAAHWMYSWGNIKREEIPENVEFVPMFWGKGSVTQDNIDRIKQMAEAGDIKFVLGFNEPDGANQANMSVDEAIELWPQLEQIGVPLVSPATVNPNNDWMKEFMRRADQEGLRVDYVAVHHYGGANVLNFINKLKETYNAYNRPLWITEFAVADWNATSPENNRYSEAEVISFMEEALVALDDIDWVYRYSWFDGKNAPLYTSALFDEDSNITPVGEVYAANKPNADIGPGMETVFEPEVEEGELMINGGFETGQIAPWQGFKNDVVGSATTAPHSGNFSGRIQNGDGSLVYVAEVEPGKSYTLRFFSKWNEVVENTFSAKLRNNEGNDLIFSLPDMPKTTEWEETVYDFTVPEGVTQLKMVFFKGKGFPPFFMDDVSLKEKENLMINGDFETGQIAPWQGFKNDVVGSATTAPHSGNFSGRIQNGDGSLVYVAEVEPGKSYTLRFFSKWNEVVENTFSAKLRNNEGNDLIFSLPDMPKTTEWEKTAYEFTVPDGLTQLKMVFFKGKGFPPFFMDDVSLSKVE